MNSTTCNPQRPSDGFLNCRMSGQRERSTLIIVTPLCGLYRAMPGAMFALLGLGFAPVAQTLAFDRADSALRRFKVVSSGRAAALFHPKRSHRRHHGRGHGRIDRWMVERSAPSQVMKQRDARSSWSSTPNSGQHAVTKTLLRTLLS
jgi:hypothetical protein